MDLILFNALFNIKNYDNVADNIWIGNALYDPQQLKKLDIEIVINCTTDLPFKCDFTRNYRIPVIHANKITEEQFNFVNSLFAENRPTFIHCYHGFMRSAAFIKKYTGKKVIKSIRC